jgi:hypothetical protein
MKVLHQPKPIEVFVRHCHFSSVSQHKKRFDSFTRERIFHNLLSTIDLKLANITFLLDTFFPLEREHFVNTQRDFPIVKIKEGTESGSFLKLLDLIMGKKFDPETIIYFLEDDYLHRSKWGKVLLEGFTLPGIDYITLYDHADKYFLPEYKHLQSTIFHTNTCHWRTTPSTTNTFATRFKTLKLHINIHRAFSLGRNISADHEKFCALHLQGAVLVSSIPGWATHAEPEFASPCTNWEHILKQNYLKKNY